MERHSSILLSTLHFHLSFTSSIWIHLVTLAFQSEFFSRNETMAKSEMKSENRRAIFIDWYFLRKFFSIFSYQSPEPNVFANEMGNANTETFDNFHWTTAFSSMKTGNSTLSVSFLFGSNVLVRCLFRFSSRFQTYIQSLIIYLKCIFVGKLFKILIKLISLTGYSSVCSTKMEQYPQKKKKEKQIDLNVVNVLMNIIQALNVWLCFVFQMI